MRLVVLGVLPQLLLGLRLAGAVDVPLAAVLVRGGSPGSLDRLCVPCVLVKAKVFVWAWRDGGCRRRRVDESLDRGFAVGGFERVLDAGQDAGDNVIRVGEEVEVGSDVNNARGACE